MKFREKFAAILKYKPDILVIPECESLEKIKIDIFPSLPTGKHWIGNNLNKGLGVFAFNGCTIERYEDYNPDFKYILPLIVAKENHTFNLLGVWTTSQPEGSYIKQLWLSLDYYRDFIKTPHTIITGDLNSNRIWDRSGDWGNHMQVVELLNSFSIKSTYHEFFREKHGSEKIPTLYMYHHRDKPYHVDYCFLSQDLLSEVKRVEVGSYDDWIKLSDHCPLIVHL